MKGDYSRLTFDPRKHYRGVLMQQGRVQVDADWNEQQAINQRYAEIEARDVIGRCGAPLHNAGFKITLNHGELVIGPGHYYVDGTLCENESDIAYHKQPDLPDPPQLAQLLTAAEPLGIVYLDVWERHITALDDPRLREVALNGPDTAARSRVVWQVKILPVKLPVVGAVNCGSKFREWDALNAPSDVTLNARTQPPATVDNPCLIPPTAGYQRLENQLYRVEVHKGGALGTATFKWSRDNGSVVTAIEKISGQEITVSGVGPDNVLGFAPSQWVELVDDRTELYQQPGQLLEIADVNPATRVIKLAVAPTLVNLNPKFRRWDGAGEITTANSWIELEGGIEVQFSVGNYRPGDYWLFSARTAIGDIEWPPYQTPNTNPIAQPPLGIEHHYCRLALVSLTHGGVEVTDDCRLLFPPLTETIASEPGIHITDVRTFMPDKAVPNDSIVSEIELVGGLAVTCDKDIDPETISQPTCFITLDMPVSSNSGDVMTFGFPVMGFQPLILASEATVTGKVISWKPREPAQDWLQETLPEMIGRLGDKRILAHLTLKGNFIWEQNNQDNPELYLDGEAFGFRGPNATTDLRLPTGDGRRGGDFEMWFWLVPTPTLISLTLAPTEVAAGISSQGTVTLSGPAPAGTVVTLTSSNNLRATVPVSVTIVTGESSANFNADTVSFIGTVAQVIITASLADKVRTAQLTVEGQPPA